MHGSLARAGKVRGQTPKVAKADKKKLPKVRGGGGGGTRGGGDEKGMIREAHLPSPPSLPSSSHQGRAMKRIKYNRRFVDVVVGMGKKKGPNSQ